MCLGFRGCTCTHRRFLLVREHVRVLPLALEGAELAGRASSRAASDRVKFAIKAARKSAKKIRLIEGSYLLRFRALSFTARADTGVHNLAALRRAFACAGNVVLGPDHLLREQQNKFVVGQSPFSHTASH